MRLYKENKYPVVQGKGNVGFCTVWTDPLGKDGLIAKHPELSEVSAIVGTLYGRNGVNILLRNLALNPGIRELYLWGHDKLSRTPFGVMGSGLLKNIWSEGIGDNGQVKKTKFYIHQEIDPDVVRKIAESVRLVDVSESSLADSIASARLALPGEPYMDPKDFPEHKPEEGQPFPSEVVGFPAVRGTHVFDAWLKVIDRIMRYGIIKETEQGTQQREIINMNWVIEGEDTTNPFIPDLPEEITMLTGLRKEALEAYYPEFMSGELPEGTAYTYGQRLWAWKTPDGQIISQVDKIIEHLLHSPVTRRAVASTWNQETDADSSTKNPPCFIEVQAIQTNGALHLVATFRSHDIMKAAIPNAFGLRRLQEHICKKTGFKVGSLAINSHSAHIYEDDWAQAKNTLNCLKWEREPSLNFDPATDADPRGLVKLHIDNGLIVAELTNHDGEPLLSIEGRSARQVGKRLAGLDLLSLPDHWLDIGGELQKAELALRYGLAYSQDKPLNLK